MLAYVEFHNFIQTECCSDEFPLENYNKIATLSHALTNQEGDFELCVDTHEPQRDIANKQRVDIATDI